jgi:hypothetical protein
MLKSLIDLAIKETCLSHKGLKVRIMVIINIVGPSLEITTKLKKVALTNYLIVPNTSPIKLMKVCQDCYLEKLMF